MISFVLNLQEFLQTLNNNSVDFVDRNFLILFSLIL